MPFGSHSGFQENKKKEPGPSHPTLLKEEKKNHPFCLSFAPKFFLQSVTPLIADDFIIVQEHYRQMKSQKFPPEFPGLFSYQLGKL